MHCRELKENEIGAAMDLAQRVFLEFEAPDYSAQGVAEFVRSINDPDFLKALRCYGAFEREELVGMIATRGGRHIALFFVDGEHQRQGIGRRLFALAARDGAGIGMTVNSSPYAEPIYRRLGFRPTDTEQVTNGIRYIPMELWR